MECLNVTTADTANIWTLGERSQTFGLIGIVILDIRHFADRYFGPDRQLALGRLKKGFFCTARFYNPYHPPVSLVGRFRLGGQVLLDIENLSLALRWAETISTTKALVKTKTVCPILHSGSFL